MINKQILIIEINEKNFKTLEVVLQKEGYSCLGIYGLDSFKELRLQADELDMIIVNAHVSYVTVEEVIRSSESRNGIKIPVLYIDSAKEHDREMLDKTFEAGVCDYMKKPFDSKEIVYRVHYHCEQLYRLREYKLRVDKLGQLATVDQLSKLTSKMHMQAILKHQLNHFHRYKNDTTLIYLSLININKLIGAFGLEQGEKIIAKFAKNLKSAIRASDVVSRWGGSEFVILLPDTSAKAGELLVKKLKQKLSNIEVMNNTMPEIAFGITGFKEGDDIDEVISRAKYALEEAKKQTYGKIHIA